MFPSKLGSPTLEETGGGLVEAFTPELREKMVRLEKQNQLLWKRVESAESAAPLRAEEAKGEWAEEGGRGGVSVQGTE